MRFVPFSVRLTTRFRGLTERSGVLIEGRGPDGEIRWGEYSPFSDYDAERASRWWRGALEAARGDWPAPVRDEVPVNAIVPEVDPERAAVMAVAGGCTTAKVKVSADPAALTADAARVEAVADAVDSFARSRGVVGQVRIDVNGGWDLDHAAGALRVLDAAARAGGVDGLQYVEQPCADVADLATLRRSQPVPVAADEAVRLPGNADAVIAADAADYLILKAHPMGGVRRALEVAETAGLPVVVSSAMESSVGLAAGVALAQAVPELAGACGLGTGALLATDTVAATWVAVDGVLRMRPLEVTA